MNILLKEKKHQFNLKHRVSIDRIPRNVHDNYDCITVYFEKTHYGICDTDFIYI